MILALEYVWACSTCIMCCELLAKEEETAPDDCYGCFGGTGGGFNGKPQGKPPATHPWRAGKGKHSRRRGGGVHLLRLADDVSGLLAGPPSAHRAAWRALGDGSTARCAD